MTIGKICECEVVTVGRDASIYDAAQLMKEENIGAIVVVEDEGSKANPCGILTDRDVIIRLLAKDVDVHQLRVADVMSEAVLVLKDSQGVKEAIEAMRERKVRRAPVVNERNEIVGITTLDDLVVLIADELHSVAELIRQQVQRNID